LTARNVSVIRKRRELLDELVQIARFIERSGGGFQQQGQTDDEKRLQISDIRSVGNRFITRTWKISRTTIHPQILVERLKNNDIP